MTHEEGTVAVVKAGIGVILVKDRKVLIGKRRGSHGEGLWAFPGGHIDPDDPTIQAAAEREVLEETGIVCKVFKIDDHRDDVFTTYDILSEDGRKRYLTSYLIAYYVSGGTFLPHESDFEPQRLQPLEPEKCEEWRFVGLGDLLDMITTDRQKTWIPVDLVTYYLGRLWGDD